MLEIAHFNKTKFLIEVVRELEIDSFRFHYKYKNERAFVERTVEFIEGLGQLEQTVDRHSEEHLGETLQSIHVRITSNLLFLSSLVELQPKDNRKIATALTKALVSKNSKVIHVLKGVEAFLWKKHYSFSETQLKKISINLLSDKSYSFEEWAIAMGNIIAQNYSTVLSSDAKVSSRITILLIEHAKKEGLSSRIDMLNTWYPSLASEDQQKIRFYIESELDREFIPNIYYSCAIHNIIYYRNYYLDFIKLVAVPGESRMHFWNKSYATSSSLSELINIAFRYKIDLDSKEFQHFKGYSLYYDWLIDMDRFDYNKFNIEWTIAYKTRYYLRTIFQNKIARAHIIEQLQKKYHPVVSEYMIRYSVEVED